MLIVSLPDRLEGLIDLARTLTRGMLVGLGPEDRIREARRVLRECDNAMFVPAPENGSIPWRDQFFTAVISSELTPEIQRVLAPGGRVLSCPV